MKTKITLLLVAGCLLCSWNLMKKNPMKKAEWLIGTWENITPRGSIYESWSKVNEQEYKGMSFMLKEQDTIVFENIRLTCEKNQLFYIPVVKNQNGGEPVRFTSKEITEDRLVFENLAHDFPQMIAYTKIGSDSLFAEISGIVKEQKRKQGFPMKRVN